MEIISTIRAFVPHFALAVLGCMALAGCGGNNTYSPTVTGNGVPPVVTISITGPSSVTTTPGGTLQFTAVVTGTSNTSVTWTVVSEDGGSISSTGLYTAPSQPGTYTVEATSVADPQESVTATATVSSSTGTVGGTVH